MARLSLPVCIPEIAGIGRRRFKARDSRKDIAMGLQACKVRAEIVHCLLMDIVGYSLNSTQQQQRLARELQEIVRSSAEYQRAEAEGELRMRNLGDGLALIFSRNLIAPIQCAIEVAHALHKRPHLPVRMGIHNGPIAWEPDLADKDNVHGNGINIAQRVMACGDAGHLLLSQRTAEDLLQFDEWAAYLHDLGEVEVKHCERVHVYNLYSEDFGNPEMPQFIRHLIHHKELMPDPGSVPQSPGGAVPLGSNLYVARPEDEKFYQAIARRDSIVLIKGARQVGKTSLLARGLESARQMGARTADIDLQTLNAPDFASADAFLKTLAKSLALQLGIHTCPRETWDPDLGANMNMNWFMESQILSATSSPVIWGLDEVDQLFLYPFSGEVFGLLRSWHNRRALEPSGPWSRLTLVIAYANEPHLFVSELNQSPFNVGTRLTLEAFKIEQVAELNRRHNAPLRDLEELTRFYRLLGGQPYLVQRGMDEMTTQGWRLEDLEAVADRDDGPFGDHLRRLVISLSRDKAQTDAMRSVLRGQPCPTPESYYHLRSAGLIAGASAREAKPRCQLYAVYLSRHLL